jgi:hypothetical protein
VYTPFVLCYVAIKVSSCINCKIKLNSDESDAFTVDLRIKDESTGQMNVVD